MLAVIIPITFRDGLKCGQDQLLGPTRAVRLESSCAPISRKGQRGEKKAEHLMFGLSFV